MASSKSVCRDVYRFGLPLLASAMILATGVAVMLAARRICAYAGPDQFHNAAWDIAWIIFWTGLAEGIALATGFFVCRRLNQRILELQTELTDLTRAVLHDLKTPITHIRNAVESTANGLREADDILPVILESCETVTDVINANAEISRTYGEGNRPPPEPLDAAIVVRQCADLYSAIADEKGIRFTTEIPAGPLPLAILKGQLQHLVNNLLDNAIKFTPAGGRVRLALAAKSKHLVLTVADTGCGIETDKQSRIFERFYRTEFARNTPGYGLGLALVDAIVTACNGQTKVISAPDRGTTFEIILPLRRK